MGNHDDYIKATEYLAVELGREPTAKEIEEEMTNREAQRIDAAYEQSREEGCVV